MDIAKVTVGQDAQDQGLPYPPGSGPPGGQQSELGAGQDIPLAQNTRPSLTLRILATTDLHAQLLSYDYHANRRQLGRGLTQTACLIEAARAETPELILLDNGDFLQGSALAEVAALPLRQRTHPAVTAFNLLGYDAVGLGNHKFDYGLPLLQAALDAARFPVLSANVMWERGPDPLQDRLFTKAFALITREVPDAQGKLRKLRIGVLGLTPPRSCIGTRGKSAAGWMRGRCSRRQRPGCRICGPAARIW